MHDANDGHEHGQAATVVPDTGTPQHVALARNADIGPFGKHGVEVGGDDQAWTTSLAAPISQHVARAVLPHIQQAEPRELGAQEAGAIGLLERRRRHLAEADLIGNGLRLARSCRVERRANGWLSRERRHTSWRLCPGDGRRQDPCDGQCESRHVRSSLHVWLVCVCDWILSRTAGLDSCTEFVSQMRSAFGNSSMVITPSLTSPRASISAR